MINTIREEIEPNAFSSNAEHFYEKDLYKKMKAKLKKKTGRGARSSISYKIETNSDLVPEHIVSSKSVGNNVKFIIPKKLLFFKE